MLVQVPRVTVRVWPSCGVPLIVGAALLMGRGSTAAVGADGLVAGDGGEVASVAVSTTSMVCPTSVDATV